MQKYLQQIANTFTKQRRHGFMFVITIVGLGVMMIIGGSFMGSATHQFAASQNDYASLHAMSMSSAGAHYAYWKSKYGGGFPNAYAENLLDDPRALISMTTPTANYQIHKFSPFDADDEFYVWVANIGRWDTEDSAKIGIGYLAISKGLWRAHSAEQDFYRGIRAIWAKEQGKPGGNLPIPLKYALFSHKDLTMSGGATVNNGDVGSNYGAFTIQNNVIIHGGSGNVFYSTPGQALNPITNRPRFPVINGQPESFKTWDWRKQDFQNAARWNYTGSNIPSTGDGFFPNTANPEGLKNIAFVTGDVDLASNYTFSKSGTIVIDGDLTVHGNIYTTSGASVVLYCMGNISVKINGGATLQAAMVAHNDDFTGTMDLSINGGASITGAILADQGVKMNGGFIINYVRPNNEESPVEPPQPPNVGEGFLSWEMF